MKVFVAVPGKVYTFPMGELDEGSWYSVLGVLEVGYSREYTLEYVTSSGETELLTVSPVGGFGRAPRLQLLEEHHGQWCYFSLSEASALEVSRAWVPGNEHPAYLILSGKEGWSHRVGIHLLTGRLLSSLWLPELSGWLERTGAGQYALVLDNGTRVAGLPGWGPTPPSLQEVYREARCLFALVED